MTKRIKFISFRFMLCLLALLVHCGGGGGGSSIQGGSDAQPASSQSGTDGSSSSGGVTVDTQTGQTTAPVQTITVYHVRADALFTDENGDRYADQMSETDVGSLYVSYITESVYDSSGKAQSRHMYSDLDDTIDESESIYEYADDGRLTKITTTTTTNGVATSPKEYHYGYNSILQQTSITTRSYSGDEQFADYITTYGYDALGLVSTVRHEDYDSSETLVSDIEYTYTNRLNDSASGYEYKRVLSTSSEVIFATLECNGAAASEINACLLTNGFEQTGTNAGCPCRTTHFYEFDPYSYDVTVDGEATTVNGVEAQVTLSTHTDVERGAYVSTTSNQTCESELNDVSLDNLIFSASDLSEQILPRLTCDDPLAYEVTLDASYKLIGYIWQSGTQRRGYYFYNTYADGVTSSITDADGDRIPGDIDMDDSNASIGYRFGEICGDGVDNNRDNIVDEGSYEVYADADGDGYGDDADTGIFLCHVPDGYSSSKGDCNDASANTNPSMPEICDNLDNNCDGTVNEGFDSTVSYRDSDGDGYGDAAATSAAQCSVPAGYVSNDDDCDDSTAATSPGDAEVCDGMDNDCDGSVDDGLATTIFYADSDGDGYGSSASPVSACAQPSGYVTTSTDCNDANSAINPGARDCRLNADGINNDCDGLTDEPCTSS